MYSDRASTVLYIRMTKPQQLLVGGSIQFTYGQGSIKISHQPYSR